MFLLNVIPLVSKQVLFCSRIGQLHFLAKLYIGKTFFCELLFFAKTSFEKKILALVMAIQKWRLYLLERKFMAQIDYQRLKHLWYQRITISAKQNGFISYWDLTLQWSTRKQKIMLLQMIFLIDSRLKKFQTHCYNTSWHSTMHKTPLQNCLWKQLAKVNRLDSRYCKIKSYQS